MSLPPDHQYVTAADAGPGAPFDAIECPSDDAEVAAADVRRVAAAGLANDASLLQTVAALVSIGYYASDSNIGLETFTTTSFVNAGSVHVDMADAKIGDVLVIDAMARAGVSNDTGWLRIAVIEQYGSGGATTHPVVGSQRVMDETSSTAGEPNYSAAAAYTVTTDGNARIVLQGRMNNSGGGRQIQLNDSVGLRVLSYRAP